MSLAILYALNHFLKQNTQIQINPMIIAKEKGYRLRDLEPQKKG